MPVSAIELDQPRAKDSGPLDGNQLIYCGKAGKEVTSCPADSTGCKTC